MGGHQLFSYAVLYSYIGVLLASGIGLLVIRLRRRKSQWQIPLLLLVPLTLGYLTIPITTGVLIYVVFGWWLGEPLTIFLYLAAVLALVIVPIRYALRHRQWQLTIVTGGATVFAALFWMSFIGGMDG